MLEETVFFQVIDPKPEAKFQQRAGHVANQRTTVVVKKLLGLQIDHQTTMVRVNSEGTLSVDLLRRSTPERFQELMAALFVCHHSYLSRRM